MLCQVTSRLHKACNNSSSRQILTLTTGETCSRRSVMNHRWMSCTHLMDIFTQQSLSLIHTRLPSAARLEGEGTKDVFPYLAACPREWENDPMLTPLIDRSSFSPALLSSYPVRSHAFVPSRFVCPRFPLSLFFFLLYFFPFHLVVSIAFFLACRHHTLPPCPPCS